MTDGQREDGAAAAGQPRQRAKSRKRRRKAKSVSGSVTGPVGGSVSTGEKQAVGVKSPSGKADQANKGRKSRTQGAARRQVRLAALDLGTNNCRLLIAAPRGGTLRIVDAFSRIVRLGEGLSQTGVLSDAAMERTINALLVCAEKIKRRGVTHMRCIATQACRGADNGVAFLDAASAQTGLAFDIITTQEESRLAVAGCAELLDPDVAAGLVFDIGGGSTELSWVRRRSAQTSDKTLQERPGAIEIAAWTSLPFGVVSLAEKWGGREIDAVTYAAIVEATRKDIAACGDPAGMKAIFEADNAHLLGTSGTVTSIAGVHLELARYRRDMVDGVWLSADDARTVTEKLRIMSFDQRASEPCIGPDRADLVVCGCAILDALLLEWPSSRIRVADRGLREGILADLAAHARKERRRKSK